LRPGGTAAFDTRQVRGSTRSAVLALVELETRVDDIVGSALSPEQLRTALTLAVAEDGRVIAIVDVLCQPPGEKC
jgi:hypothetical protein